MLTNQTTIEFHMNMAGRQIARKKGEVYRTRGDCGHESVISSFLIWSLTTVKQAPRHEHVAIRSFREAHIFGYAHVGSASTESRSRRVFYMLCNCA